MITYTGIHITREFGAPSIRDLAVQSMRLVRFVGAGEIWWPVGMHQMLVADLVPDALEVDALIHDGSEVVTNDIPQPFKVEAQRVEEHKVEARMYDLLGLELPTETQRHFIKEADIKACCAEGTLGCGPYAFPETQHNYNLDPEAQNRLTQYLEGWNPMDAIDPNGKWPLIYENRLRSAIRARRERQRLRQEAGSNGTRFENDTVMGARIQVSGLRDATKIATSRLRKERMGVSRGSKSTATRTARAARA